MNNTSKKCKYKLVLIKWSRTMFSQPPPQGHGYAGQNIDSSMQIGQYGQTGVSTQQVVSTPASSYSSFVTDHSGYQYPMAVYPITKNYAVKEMQGMERNLVSKSDWVPEGFHVVQKAVEEVNEKDRMAGAVLAASAFGGGSSRSGGGSGFSDDASRSGGGGGAREEPYWEMCGFRYDGINEWNQIALLLEKVVEEGGEN